METARTTPQGLIHYSKSFRDTALAAIDSQKRTSEIESVPVTYLIAHSIELSLKAFLLHKGIELPILKKKYGHDLVKSLNKSKKFGLGDLLEISEVEESAFQALNDLYYKKELNYISVGGRRFPKFEPIETLSKNLLVNIGREVDYPVNRLV